MTTPSNTEHHDELLARPGSLREETVRLTTGQALVRFLQVQHSERDGDARRLIPAIWGIFGHGNALGLGQAILQEGTELPLYQPKNEQAMVHAAIGYAKATRRLATLACTASIGPGATNMLTGAATATVNRLPVLLLPADTFANRRQGPVLQQLEHPTAGDISVNDAFGPSVASSTASPAPSNCLPRSQKRCASSGPGGHWRCHYRVAPGRPRPRLTTTRPASSRQRRGTSRAARPRRDEIDRARRAITLAERPLIIAGGGVRYSGAEQALAAFADRFGVPVAETSAGKGSLGPRVFLVGGIGVNGTRAANQLAARRTS